MLNAEASWRAVDRALNEVENWQKKKRAVLRKKKWGDAAWDVTKKKKRKYTTKKDVEKAAQRMFGHITTYNLLRAIAVHSGQTIEEVAAGATNGGTKKKIVRGHSGSSRQEVGERSCAAQGGCKKERAEREAIGGEA